ncbi:hypothetical protein Pst134EA_006942 [Puccinia striiformis f. sp. tritici]|uniref:hypothetical protein n=1 Tax=Puccinia striiformis f. sp. tritici TaxID=168172 RepID=UPI0020083849|nr:hypothetical protein Pst134EA_006942 [Puccinia striiformis f. sp. tritici]KAH9469656.1 hypothetical protein Pst134EA_006942 [Puccinia striiformis f. sp. tritici]
MAPSASTDIIPCATASLPGDVGAGVSSRIPAENLPKLSTGVEAIYPLDLIEHAKALEFFKKSTGIEDPSVLKGHVLKIREAAYKIYPYPCIWGFEFLKGKTLSHPFYPRMKANQLSDQDQKIFVDLGAFVGVDLKQVVEDGWDANNVLGIDIHHEWIDIGHELFRDGQQLPSFLGDILLETTLNSAPAEEAQPVLDLRNLKDLNPLKGRVSFICANQLFHLFLEDDQRELAERCGRLLSNEPGSAIFGTQVGAAKEMLSEIHKVQLQSPESFEKLWKETLGKNVEVVVTAEEDASLQNYRSFNPGQIKEFCWLHWSVVRL